MANPNSDLSDLQVLVHEQIESKLRDSASNANQFMRELNKAGRKKTYKGGEYIRVPITFQGNGTYTRFTNWQNLNISPKNTVTAARYKPKESSVSLAISGTEMNTVRGDAELVDLYASRADGMEVEFKNNFGTDLYSTGTADGGMQINGVQSFITTAPASGTTGGIPRATNDFWQNQYLQCSAQPGGVATSLNIHGYMMEMAISITVNEGVDSFDAIFADSNFWQLYYNSRDARQRIENGRAESLGPSLTFLNKPVYLDGGIGGSCPADSMYFIRYNDLALYVHPGQDFSQLGKTREPLRQNGQVKLYGFMGNLVASSLRQLGVIQN